MVGKCPKCDGLVTRLVIHGVDASALMGKTFHAITYNCPLCNCVLSCGIDPIALKSDTVKQTTEAVISQLRR